MFHVIFGAPCLYVILRFLLPLSLPHWATLASALVLIAGSQFHFWNRLSSGSVFSPEFPRAMVMAFNVVFGLILFLALLQIVLDIGTLIGSALKGSWISVPNGVRYALALVAFGLSAVGVEQASRVPSVTEVVVAIADLPPEFEGYRILQLTDLHLSRLFQAPWAEKVVSRANGVEADLIAITGDFIDGSLEARRRDIEPLGRLAAQDGVWAIPGNHEYFFGLETWMQHFRSLGMRTLANQHAVVEKGGAKLVLAGVTDLSAPAYGLPGPDVAKALEGAPAGAPVVLLDHQPRMAALAAEVGVDLQLSGHTHGGMILGLHRLLEGPNGGFVSGLYRVKRMALYVGNGAGIWPGFALRLGKPSEMTVFTLRKT
jgi:predicted MPP superfamily phosphohydrolase